MELRTGCNWYAVRVRGRQRCVTGGSYTDPARVPFQVEHFLRMKGFETFVPRRTVFRFVNKVQAKRRIKREVPRPLLIGWVFVGMPAGQERWRDLFDTPGVIGVAGVDGTAARVNEAALRQMAKRFGDGLLTAHERERYMRSRAEYAPGQVVRFTDHPFDGWTGKVVAVKGAQAKVLLSMLGAERTVDVDTMLLEAA